MAETRARLFVLAGPDLARSFPLGERTTLGRSDECDVVLRDRSISRKHAVLVHDGEQWFVQDLGSTNGVSKGGKRAERIELADGDEFKLGDLPLRLRLETEAGEQEIEFDLAPPKAAPAPAVAPPPPAAPRAPAKPKPEEPAEADEIEIEEVELEDAPTTAGGPPRREPLREPLAATTFRAPRTARRTGFFASDLEQMPFWMRIAIVLALAALAAGCAWGAFVGVQFLRAGL